MRHANPTRGRFIALFALLRPVGVAMMLTLGWRCCVFDIARADEVAASNPLPKVLRYDDDCRYLVDPSRHDDLWDPIKFIPLTALKESYLTIGGEWRERFESYENPTFGLHGVDDDRYLLQRFLLNADLHLGEDFRTFVQLGSYQQFGRQGGPLPTDEDDLDLQQGFLEAKVGLDAGTQLGARAGRQEIILGSGRLVTMREGPNIRRSFDGLRTMFRAGDLRLDGLLVRTVEINNGIFDDKTDPDQSLWGLYAVMPFPGISGAHLDLYYLGLETDTSVYAAGVGGETRHSLGTRFWGVFGPLDYNLEALYQLGSFDGSDIRAWGASSDIGVSFADFWLRPRLGLKADAESGDSNLADHQLETFNPLFPNHAYFSEAALAAPVNSLDVHPNVTFWPLEGLSVNLGVDFFWRENTDDAIYSASLTPIAGTAGGNDRYIGSLITAHGQWHLDRHVELNLDYTHFNAGATVTQAGGTDVDFFMFSAAYRF